MISTFSASSVACAPSATSDHGFHSFVSGVDALWIYQFICQGIVPRLLIYVRNVSLCWSRNIKKKKETFNKSHKEMREHWCAKLDVKSCKTICRFFFFFLINYLFLAALGLRCCAWAFSSCGEWGLLFVAVHGLLIAVASLVVGQGL